MIAIRPRARLDLLEQFVYLAEKENVELAERFLAAVEATFERIAAHPLAGLRYLSGIGRLRGMRRAPVREFENYLIFYVPRPNGIDIIRVLQGKRDIAAVLRRDESI